MRIGLGGSVFGVRAGVSNRGFGGGLGPLSVGGSWGGRGSRRSSPGGGFWGFALASVAAFLAVAWPYELGTFIVVQAGADNPSATRTAVGWILEVPWLVFLVFAARYALTKYGKRKQAETEHARAQAQFHAPRPTRGPGSSIAYHHGACTINHRTPDAAGRCTKG